MRIFIYFKKPFYFKQKIEIILTILFKFSYFTLFKLVVPIIKTAYLNKNFKTIFLVLASLITQPFYFSVI